MKRKGKNGVVGYMLLLLVPPIILSVIYMISLFVQGLITRNVDQNFMFTFMETILMITFGGVLFVLFIFSVLFGTMGFLPRGIKHKSELLLINDNVINVIKPKKDDGKAAVNNTNMIKNEMAIIGLEDEENISAITSNIKH